MNPPTENTMELAAKLDRHVERLEAHEQADLKYQGETNTHLAILASDVKYGNRQTDAVLGILKWIGAAIGLAVIKALMDLVIINNGG